MAQPCSPWVHGRIEHCPALPRRCQINESYLRLGFAADSEYSDPAQFEPELRFRLDVPTAEKKLRLVVESESEELIPLAERERDRQLTEPERTDTETTGALRFLTDVGDSINLSTDIGGRLRLPPELFWRMKARKGWKSTTIGHSMPSNVFTIIIPKAGGSAVGLV